MSNSNRAGRPLVGAGHRRMPGDVVTGKHHEVRGEIIGRVVRANANGSCIVRLDDERELTFTALQAARLLRTVEEVDAPMLEVRHKRARPFSIRAIDLVLDETATEAA